MNTQTILNLILGNVGTLALLLLVCYALVTRRWIVPEPFLAAAEERVQLLEQENSELNESVKTLTEGNSKLSVEVAVLRSEVQHLRESVAGLQSRDASGS